MLEHTRFTAPPKTHNPQNTFKFCHLFCDGNLGNSVHDFQYFDLIQLGVIQILYKIVVGLFTVHFVKEYFEDGIDLTMGFQGCILALLF